VVVMTERCHGYDTASAVSAVDDHRHVVTSGINVDLQQCTATP